MAENITNNVKSLKQELKEAVLLAQQLSATPGPEFDAAINQAAQLRDQMNDVNERIAVMTAGSKFEMMGNAIGDVGSKIMSLDFEGASEAADKLVQLSQNISFGDAVQGVSDLGKALGKMGKALLTNPLFLLIAAIGTIAYYWDDILAAVSRVSDEQERLNRAAEANVKAAQASLEAVSAQENILRLSGLSEREILELKIKQTDEVIAAAEIQLEQTIKTKKEQVAIAKRNKDILGGILEFVSAPLMLLLRSIDAVADFVGLESNLAKDFKNWTTNLVFDPEQTAKDADKTIDEQRKGLLKLKNDRAGAILSLQKLDEADAKERNANAKKNAEEREKTEREITDLRLANMQDGITKELAINEEKYRRLVEDAKGNKEKIKLLQEAGLIEQNAIYKKYDDELIAAFKLAEENKRIAKEEADAKETQRLKDNAELRLELFASEEEKEIAAIKEKYAEKALLAQGDSQLLIALAAHQANEIEAIEKKSADKKKAEDKQLQDAKISMASDTLSVIADIASLFAGKSEAAAKKAFQVNKAVSIAQTLISTYQGAQAAYASALAIPGAGVFLAPAAAGIAIAGGLAKVAKISSTKFEGGSSSGGGGANGGYSSPTASAPAQPSFNLFGQPNQGNNASATQSAESNTNITVTAVVSESEITSTQNKVAKMQKNAEL